ncbi:MAG: FtsX-like permease family protein [Desulfobacterales bacterium]
MKTWQQPLPPGPMWKMWNMPRSGSIVLTGSIIYLRSLASCWPGFFFIATFLIIANTIRLIMYSRREEIEVIRIIGADEAFIKYPLFIAGLAQGFLGGIAGVVLLYLAYILTVPNFSRDTVFSFFEIRFVSMEFAVALIFCSMMIGWVGCYFSIRKFLKL